jgi:hypothetical protein
MITIRKEASSIIKWCEFTKMGKPVLNSEPGSCQNADWRSLRYPVGNIIFKSNCGEPLPFLTL